MCLRSSSLAYHLRHELQLFAFCHVACSTYHKRWLILARKSSKRRPFERPSLRIQCCLPLSRVFYVRKAPFLWLLVSLAVLRFAVGARFQLVPVVMVLDCAPYGLDDLSQQVVVNVLHWTALHQLVCISNKHLSVVKLIDRVVYYRTVGKHSIIEEIEGALSVRLPVPLASSVVVVIDVPVRAVHSVVGNVAPSTESVVISVSHREASAREVCCLIH